MKYKLIIIFLLALLHLSCVSETITPVIEEAKTEPPAEVPEKPAEELLVSIFTPTPLEYVIYYDTRMNDAYLSIAYMDNDTYLVSRRELDTGNTITLTMTITITNETLEPGNIKMIQGNMTDAFSANIIQDIMNMAAQRCRTAVDVITEKVELQDEWPDYTLIHSYNKWIPLFNLYSTRVQSETENKIQLIKIGTLKSTNNNNFYDFELPAEINKTPDYIIDNYFDIIRNINNVAAIRLDEYWTLNDNNMYVIAYETLMDAVIYAELIDLSSLNMETIDDFIKANLCHQENYVDTKSISVNIFSSYLTLSYNLYDSRTMSYSKAYNVFVPRENENIFIVVTLNTFLTLYNSNTNYFNKILF